MNHSATSPQSTEPDAIRESVRAHYSAVATSQNVPAGACGCTTSGSCCSPTNGDTRPAYGERLGYSTFDLAAAPTEANLNLGCGNPIAIASIRANETVLDLGSGAGFDAFLAARQLAGSGRVIGVDMTPAMITRARRNASRAGFANVEFRLGEIEHLPVADQTVDLIISNCVINLSPDKPQVLREAFRVLKSGGRLALADVVAIAPIPEQVRNDPTAYAGCVAGAPPVQELHAMLLAAGFTAVTITAKDESRSLINDWTEGGDAGNFVASAIIAAVKP